MVFSGVSINLALGILYSWSIISSGVPAAWGWSETEKSLPYSVSCLVFCLMMVPAGRLQDRAGPSITAAMGGILVGAGMILSSLFDSPVAYVLGFGFLTGSGIAFGYGSTVPPAVKWFPRSKTGMISGVVVSGSGLASVYAAPLSEFLISRTGISWTMRILGIGIVAVVTVFSAFLKSPPRGFDDPGPGELPACGKPGECSAFDMLRDWRFYLLWAMYACGAGAGLMVISKLKLIAGAQAGLSLGFILVAVLAIGNGGGRILAGLVSDRIGRRAAFIACFLFQAVLILLLSTARSGTYLAAAVPLSILCMLIGANYGANLSLFPSISKDYFGLKNFGVNYGLLFTSWGLGGFMLSLVAGKAYDMSGSFDVAYYMSCVLLVLAAAGAFLLRSRG